MAPRKNSVNQDISHIEPPVEVNRDQRERVVMQAASFSGPLPPPDILRGYNDIIPNGAERIIAMAERQSAHRESLEKAVVESNIKVQSRGNWFAFIIAMTAILGGIFLIFEGKDTGGLTAIISAIAGIAGVFIYSKVEQAQQRRSKLESLPKPQPGKTRA